VTLPSRGQAPALAIAYCRMLTDYLRLKRHPLRGVLEALGIEESALGDPDLYIPRAAFDRALEHAVALTGDAFLGLHAGEQIRPAHYGVLGYVMMSCDTSRQLIERHRRWHQLVARGARIEYEETPDRLTLRETPPEGCSVIRPAGECHMSAMLTFARWVFGRQFRPLEVRFPHAAPASLGEYERVFQCRLVFGSPSFGLSIANGLLDRPLPHADAALRESMEARAARLAQALRIEDDDFAVQLRQALGRLLPGASPDLGAVAAALCISPRTLQRRLVARGTNYRKALDAARRELALAYVRDPQLSLVDVAFLTGFSQQSAFNRAFRRWAQRTPLQVRQQSLKEHGAA
jgi:AraC-like DNA-binding protein